MKCGICHARLTTRGRRITNGRNVPIYAPCPNLDDPAKHLARHRGTAQPTALQSEAPFITGTRLRFLGSGPFAARLVQGAEVEVWNTIGTRSLFRGHGLIGAIWPEHAKNWERLSEDQDQSVPIQSASKGHFQPRGDRASLGNAARNGDPKGSAESQTALDHPVKLRSADTLGADRIATKRSSSR